MSNKRKEMAIEANSATEDKANTNADWIEEIEELLEQKQYITQLQTELDTLREEVKLKKQELKSAEARLFALIEDAGQKRLPLK